MDLTGRLLGLDAGQRRIGVAVSDPLGLLATPHGIIAAGADEGLGEVCACIGQLEVTTVVVGLPLTLSGEEGPEAQRVLGWVERLRERTPIPIVLWDERLSTAAAERAMLEAGLRRDKRKLHRDAVAAALILQSYLDAHHTRQDNPLR
jgi:putative Holliday junction resolvase